MKDVKATLALAWEASQKAIESLREIAATHDFTLETVLANETIEDLVNSLADLEDQVREAKLRVAGHLVLTSYAIGKETAPGEYAGFTHGPVQDRDDLTNLGGLEDGDALVRIQSGGGVVNYLTEYIWLDEKWNATEDDEPKEASA
jgi:hypothetical protein